MGMLGQKGPMPRIAAPRARGALSTRTRRVRGRRWERVTGPNQYQRYAQPSSATDPQAPCGRSFGVRRKRGPKRGVAHRWRHTSSLKEPDFVFVVITAVVGVVGTPAAAQNCGGLLSCWGLVDEKDARHLKQFPLSTGITAAAAVKIDAPPVSWEDLDFSLKHVCPSMFLASFTPEHGWRGSMRDFGPISILPSAQVLSYGQSVMEGMKAQRTHADRTVLFRPQDHARRMAAGAARMCMPELPEVFFLQAAAAVASWNADWLPPVGRGALYLRPLLLGTGPVLGVTPAASYTFLCYAAAVGSYFSAGELQPIKMKVEEDYHRAPPRGGMGSTKAAGNYSPCILPAQDARAQGYDDILFLDARSSTFLEEATTGNVFVVKGKRIKTPPSTGTILRGVTRSSILQLAEDAGYDVQEGPITVQEAMAADEVFTCGTGVVVRAVSSLTWRGQQREFGEQGQPTPVALQMYSTLTGMQTELIPDPYGWLYPIESA